MKNPQLPQPIGMRLRSFIERDNRILDEKGAALGLFLLLILALVRYTKHWTIAGLGLGGYSAIEAGCCLAIAGAGYLIYSLLPPLTQRAAKSHQRAGASPHANDPLLTLRASACLFVLLGHGFLIAFPPSGLQEAIRNNAFYTYFLPEPWVGVWIFFTLSGYLMGKGFFFGRYSPTTLGCFSFYRNRLLRIVPMYLAGTLLVAAFAKPEFFYPSNFSNALNLLLFFDFSGNSSTPNGALWSVGTEMEFYLFVPFLFVLLRRILNTKVSAASTYLVILVSGLALRISSLKFQPEYIFGGSFLGNFDFFLCGFCLSAMIPLFRRSSGNGFRMTVTLIGLIGYYVIASYFCKHGRMLREPTPTFIWLVILPSFTLLLTSIAIFLMETGSFDKEWWLTRLVIKRTQLFGILTYALYVWHEPTFLADHFFIGSRELSLQTSLELLLLNLCKVFVLACFFYYLIEKRYDEKRTVYANQQNENQ